MMHPMQINSSDYKSRPMDNMALLSSMGMAENQCFINSGCSTSIIHDRTLLRNICPLPQPVLVAGLVGLVNIHLQADLHVPILNADGKMVTLLVPNVYYNPDAQFNLISCSQLEDLGYDVHFRQRKIDSNNVEIPITHTGSIYALQCAGKPQYDYACNQHESFAAICRMTKHELWHRCLMHTSYSKLHAASRLNLPGMPVLSEHEYPCTTCQDANVRSNPRPGLSDCDTCDVAFDMFDMSKHPSLGGH